MNAVQPPDTLKSLAARFDEAPDGATVVLAPGRHVVRAPIVLTRSVRVRGAADGTTVIDGAGATALFVLLGESQRYAFEGLALVGGAGQGGAALASSNRNEVGFEACRFGANAAQTGGGAVLLHHARGYFRRCVFEQNRAVCGGAIGVGSRCDVTVDRCLFIENVAEAGGAVFLDDDAALEIRSSTFTNNRAERADCGNALCMFGNRRFGPSAFLANSIFSGKGALASDPGGKGVAFVTHSAVPADAFAQSNFKDVGKNSLGPVALVDLGDRLFALDPSSPAAGTADISRIVPGSVDIRGTPLVNEGRASPGALALIT